MAHSPEPWRRGTDGLIFDADDAFVTDTCGTSLANGEENQKRIAACVNALAGIPTSVLLAEHHLHVTTPDGHAWAATRTKHEPLT